VKIPFLGTIKINQSHMFLLFIGLYIILHMYDGMNTTPINSDDTGNIEILLFRVLKTENSQGLD
jgi:hypothetical protein